MMPLGAAGVAGAASSKQSAHNSLRKRLAELESTRQTMSDHIKIPKDEVSLASINVYHSGKFKSDVVYKYFI